MAGLNSFSDVINLDSAAELCKKQSSLKGTAVWSVVGTHKNDQDGNSFCLFKWE